MKKVSFGFALICISILLAQSNPAYAVNTRKPAPPLQVAISPVDTAITPESIKPGDIVEFKVTTVSLIDVPELHLDIELIDGTKLVSGVTSWRGPAAKNEEKSITLSVQAPEVGNGKLRARASLEQSVSSRFAKQAVYTLGPETKNKSSSANDHPVKKDEKRQGHY